jgi:hypothetical protein
MMVAGRERQLSGDRVSPQRPHVRPMIGASMGGAVRQQAFAALCRRQANRLWRSLAVASTPQTQAVPASSTRPEGNFPSALRKVEPDE